MSLVRVGHGVYVDPYTRMEVTAPEPPPIYPEAPVFRRKATPEELARLDGPDLSSLVDAIGLIPRPIRGRLTDAERTTRAEMREAGRRGAAATKAKAKRTRREIMRDRAKVTDAEVCDAIRASNGSKSRASLSLGLSRMAVWYRVRTMQKHGDLPGDVARLLEDAARRQRGEAA